MAKPEERIKARQLRKAGESIKEIARKLEVSPSSVSLWCRDIKLSPDQILALERRSKDPYYGRRLSYALAQQKKRIERTKKLIRQGKKDVGRINKRELFLVGVALYWAEGFKKDSQVGFASSDPEMVKLFLRWLSECCGYEKDDLRLRVTANITHKYRIDEIQNYWAQISGVDVESFQKPYFQRTKWKKKYDNPRDYFGVLRVRVRRSRDFLRRIQGWIEGLKDQVGSC